MTTDAITKVLADQNIEEENDWEISSNGSD